MQVRATPDGGTAAPDDPFLRAMSLTATARSIRGTLRQEVTIDGRHRVVTDEPVRLGGDGSGPSPHELFPAALAACVATTLVVYAQTKGWDIGDVEVAVDYDNRSTPRAFDIAIRVGGPLDHAQLERLERVARSCPLRRSLESGITFHEEIATVATPDAVAAGGAS